MGGSARLVVKIYSGITFHLRRFARSARVNWRRCNTVAARSDSKTDRDLPDFGVLRNPPLSVRWTCSRRWARSRSDHLSAAASPTLRPVKADFHRIVYAASAEAAQGAYSTFERTWGKRCPGAVTSLREGGDELLTFFRFPRAQWKTLRTTNVIERLHEEFRRRVKTQGSLPGEDSAVILLFSLVASGQIKLRRIDGWRKIAAMLSQQTATAA